MSTNGSNENQIGDAEAFATAGANAFANAYGQASDTMDAGDGNANHQTGDASTVLAPVESAPHSSVPRHQCCSTPT